METVNKQQLTENPQSDADVSFSNAGRPNKSEGVLYYWYHVCVFCERFDAVCSLEVLADAAKTNVKVLVALQDIARGSKHSVCSGQKISAHEGIKVLLVCTLQRL